MLFPFVWTFAGFFCFSSVCFLGQWALPLCLLLHVLCLRFSSLRLQFMLGWYTLLSCECCYYFYGVSSSFGSPVPFATWSPFGTSQGLLQPLFLSVLRVASYGGIHFCMGLRSVPLTHSHLRFPYQRGHPLG